MQATGKRASELAGFCNKHNLIRQHPSLPQKWHADATFCVGH